MFSEKHDELFARTPYEEEYEGYIVKQCEGQMSAFYEIKRTQGKLPDVLTGRFTSLNQAKQAVDVWNRQRKPSVKRDSAKD